MATDANSPKPSNHLPEGLTSLEEYRRAAEHERIKAQIELKNALLKLKRTRSIVESPLTDTHTVLVDEHGRFYTTDLALARTVGRETVPILAYGPRDLLSEDVLDRYPSITAMLSSPAGRLESITFDEDRLVLGIPMLDQDTYIDARCYLDHRSVILTVKRAAYLTRTGERETITAVRHGLPLETIAEYLIAQGTPNHLIDEALTLIEKRRAARPE